MVQGALPYPRLTLLPKRELIAELVYKGGASLVMGEVTVVEEATVVQEISVVDATLAVERALAKKESLIGKDLSAIGGVSTDGEISLTIRPPAVDVKLGS